MLLDIADGSHAGRNAATCLDVAEQDSHAMPGRRRSATARCAGAPPARCCAATATRDAACCEIDRRWQRRPRHAARELPGGIRCRRSTIGSPRWARRRTTPVTRATSRARRQELKQALLAPDRRSPESRPAFATATRRGRAAGGSRRWRARTRCWPSRSSSRAIAPRARARRDAEPGEVSGARTGRRRSRRCAADRNACSRPTRSCADVGEAAERRCLARVRGGRQDRASPIVPDVGRYRRVEGAGPAALSRAAPAARGRWSATTKPPPA